MKTTDQTKIEFAYMVRDLLMAKRRTTFEQANCYQSCFRNVQAWLENVDPEYKARHREVVDFFKHDRQPDQGRLFDDQQPGPDLSKYDYRGGPF